MVHNVDTELVSYTYVHNIVSTSVQSVTKKNKLVELNRNAHTVTDRHFVVD